MSRRIAVRCIDTLFERFSLFFARFRITWKFFNLNSRFAKAGRHLGPVHMDGGGGPQVGR